MNYTTLQADVAAYLHRTDLTSVIPSFIERARVRIGRDLKSVEQETTATISSFTAGVGALPADCMEVIRVTNGDSLLRAVNMQEVAFFMGASDPVVYAVYGRNLLCPGASSLSLTYLKIEAVLSSGATEHPTMAAHPQVWTAASVMEGALYAHDTALYDYWAQAYRDEVFRVNAQARRLRTGPAPGPVASEYNVTSGGSIA